MERVQQVCKINRRHCPRHDERELQEITAVRTGEYLSNRILHKENQESDQNEIVQQDEAGTGDVYGGNRG